MNPTWVVQANLLNRTRQDNVAEILGRLNISFVGVNVIPFSDELQFLFDEPVHDLVIPYGSASLIRRGIRKGWKGLFFGEHFNVRAWLSNRTDMLNDDARILRASELRTFGGVGTHWHLRPVDDLKTFAGSVMSIDEINEWMETVDPYAGDEYGALTPRTEIAISSAKEILAEWRWFVVGRKIVDGSMYRNSGQALRRHENDADVISEAQSMANDWLPNPCCVMDVALTEDGPRVIEFNCLNGSGFYDHDVEKIIVAVTDFVKS